MKEKIKILLQGWLIHFGLLLVVLNLFYVLRYLKDLPYVRSTPWEYFVRHTFHDPEIFTTLFAFLLIEINYQYLFKKLRLPLFILSCLMVGAVAYLTQYYFVISNKSIHLDLEPEPVFIIAAYTLIYAIVRNYLFQIRYKKDVQLQQSKNELDALKAQLNPHFLFNSLNYLYGTALAEKAAQTADGIDKLSDMMRYTITGIHQNFVPVENELKFIEHYLTLQQARLPKKENIKIDIQLPDAIPALQIAPLLILPFIENAFKYGISMDEPCFVSIKIEVTQTGLAMQIANSIISGPIEIKGNNTGIKNTIKRLKLLYADNYQLQQTSNGHQYKTVLNIKLNP